MLELVTAQWRTMLRNTEEDKDRRQGTGIQTHWTQFLGGRGDCNMAQSIKSAQKLTQEKVLQSNPKERDTDVQRVRMFESPADAAKLGYWKSTGERQERKGVKLGLLQGWDSTWSLILLLLLL